MQPYPAEEYVEFRPHVGRWAVMELRRWTLVACGYFVVIVLARRLGGTTRDLEPMTLGQILFLVIVPCVSMLLALLISYFRCTRHYGIRVNSQEVRGPVPPLNWYFRPPKTVIALSQLDRERSANRTRWERHIEAATLVFNQSLLHNSAFKLGGVSTSPRSTDSGALPYSEQHGSPFHRDNDLALQYVAMSRAAVTSGLLVEQARAVPTPALHIAWSTMANGRG